MKSGYCLFAIYNKNGRNRCILKFYFWAKLEILQNAMQLLNLHNNGRNVCKKPLAKCIKSPILREFIFKLHQPRSASHSFALFPLAGTAAWILQPRFRSERGEIAIVTSGLNSVLFFLYFYSCYVCVPQRPQKINHTQVVVKCLLRYK